MVNVQGHHVTCLGQQGHVITFKFIHFYLIMSERYQNYYLVACCEISSACCLGLDCRSLRSRRFLFNSKSINYRLLFNVRESVYLGMAEHLQKSI